MNGLVKQMTFWVKRGRKPMILLLVKVGQGSQTLTKKVKGSQRESKRVKGSQRKSTKVKI